MEQVADDGDLEALELAEVLAHRVEVEQGLGGMCMLAVAGIDNAGVGVVRDEFGGAGIARAADEHVDAVGVERLDGVLKALTLGDGGA